MQFFVFSKTYLIRVRLNDLTLLNILEIADGVSSEL